MNSLKIIIELILLVHFTKCSELIVNTSYGMLIGREFTSRNGRIVAAFNGIPYAQPPIDDLRFQDPQPAEPWSGVREAYNFGSVCSQIPILLLPVSTTKLGNEDCLYLSVYSSDLKPKILLPVLVYLHGGEMYSGSGEIDKSPEFFMDHNLVVVMANFRLGIFGFLSMEDDVIPGNLGLKDQILALVWVQNNIANFGGDPKQVTLIGDSIGAAFVSFQMYLPKSKGLFHRAICQAGTALSAWASTPHGVARSRATKLAQVLNCSTESSKAILDCLRTKNSYEILESYRKLTIFQMDPVILFAPIIDNNAKNTVLPFNPHHAEPAAVPWIVGITSSVGLVRSGAFVPEPDCLAEYNKRFLQIAPVTLYYDHIVKNPVELAKDVRKFYFGDKPITMSLFSKLTDMFTDAYITWPVIESLQKHRGRQYLYFFDFLGRYSFQEILASKRVISGSSGFDDTIYTWGIKNPIEIPPPCTRQDLYISHLLVKLFYNFASSGEPTPSGFDFTWPQWDNKKQNFIYIGNSGVRNNRTLLPERVKFWSYLNKKYNLEGN